MNSTIRDDEIPERWYAKTQTTFICLRCHRVFSRQYKSRDFHARKKARGTNMFSVWAWHNFKKHLLKCWGGSGKAREENLRLEGDLPESDVPPADQGREEQRGPI